MGTQVTGNHTAAPIFVVGSPRSGTSILTWCLGQHSNILPTEESDWLGPFAVQIAAHHRLGTARGERSQLSALGIERDEFFQTIGAQIDALILGHRANLEHLNWLAAQREPRQAHREFAVSRDAAQPKRRWVDGTPEYSLFICALHNLFPAAKFVHIVRNADHVAASMLAFRREENSPLVAGLDEAYAYWQRTTQACLLAGEALGAQSVYRLRYDDLIAAPEKTLQQVLAFLGEPFESACIEPLALRINSSFVEPAANTDPALMNCPSATPARDLSLAIAHCAQPAPEPNAQALAALREGFEARVAYQLTLDARHCELQCRFQRLVQQTDSALATADAKLRDTQRRLDLCGVLCVLQLAAALLLTFGIVVPWVYICCAATGILIYAWLRRAGLRAWWVRAMGGTPKLTEEKPTEMV
jgi:hypothetical protein